MKVAVRLDRWVGAVSPDRPGPVARWDWAAAPAGAVERPGRQAAVGRRDRAAAPAAEARADLPAVAAPGARQARREAATRGAAVPVARTAVPRSPARWVGCAATAAASTSRTTRSTAVPAARSARASRRSASTECARRRRASRRSSAGQTRSAVETPVAAQASSAATRRDLRAVSADLLHARQGTANLSPGLRANLRERSPSEEEHRARRHDEILKKVGALPISTWSYTNEPADVRHLGPMAQDFRASFGLGSDDRTFHSVDAHGVALAAIQALERVVAAQEKRIQRLERENRRLERRSRSADRAPGAIP